MRLASLFRFAALPALLLTCCASYAVTSIQLKLWGTVDLLPAQGTYYFQGVDTALNATVSNGGGHTISACGPTGSQVPGLLAGWKSMVYNIPLNTADRSTNVYKGKTYNYGTKAYDLSGITACPYAGLVIIDGGKKVGTIYVSLPSGKTAIADCVTDPAGITIYPGVDVTKEVLMKITNVSTSKASCTVSDK